MSTSPEANPLADFPTVFLLRRVGREQADVLEWTRAALKGLSEHYGDEPAPWPSGETEMTPRRDRRFRDRFNTSAKIDRYYSDESRPADERAFALAYKRLREMDVPESIGPDPGLGLGSALGVPHRPQPPTLR